MDKGKTKSKGFPKVRKMRFSNELEALEFFREVVQILEVYKPEHNKIMIHSCKDILEISWPSDLI